MSAISDISSISDRCTTTGSRSEHSSSSSVLCFMFVYCTYASDDVANIFEYVFDETSAKMKLEKSHFINALLANYRRYSASIRIFSTRYVNEDDEYEVDWRQNESYETVK